MSKGERAQIGDENVAVNGYHYVKTSTGWRLKHHLVAEKTLGRAIRKDELVSFKDKDRTNFKPDNIIVTKKSGTKNSSLNKRLTTIEERMLAYVEDHGERSVAIRELQEAVDHIREVM